MTGIENKAANFRRYPKADEIIRQLQAGEKKVAAKQEMMDAVFSTGDG